VDVVEESFKMIILNNNEDDILLAQDFDLNNPRLHLAIAKGNLGDVCKYIEEGDNIYEQGIYGSSTLEIAARHGRLDIISVLIEAGARIDRLNRGVSTPLHEATLYGHYNIASFLIQSGADVNSLVEDDETPLMYAASTGHLEIVKLLVESGANVNLHNYNGYSAIVKSVLGDYEEVYQFLYPLVLGDLQKKAKVEKLMQSARTGNVENVKQIIEEGIDINITDNDGWTALMNAAWSNQASVLGFLIKKGADLKFENEVGDTAFLLATQKENNVIINLLKSNLDL
jgi:uncharacterized protein